MYTDTEADEYVYAYIQLKCELVWLVAARGPSLPRGCSAPERREVSAGVGDAESEGLGQRRRKAQGWSFQPRVGGSRGAAPGATAGGLHAFHRQWVGGRWRSHARRPGGAGRASPESFAADRPLVSSRRSVKPSYRKQPGGCERERREGCRVESNAACRRTVRWTRWRCGLRPRTRLKTRHFSLGA